MPQHSGGLDARKYARRKHRLRATVPEGIDAENLTPHGQRTQRPMRSDCRANAARPAADRVRPLAAMQAIGARLLEAMKPTALHLRPSNDGQPG
jgi:hypothetical protein